MAFKIIFALSSDYYHKKKKKNQSFIFIKFIIYVPSHIIMEPIAWIHDDVELQQY